MYDDIYAYLSNYLINNNWLESDFDAQKRILEEGFKDYILLKIYSIKADFRKINNDLSLKDLYLILSSLIPKEEHFKTLRFFTHYLLSIISDWQNYEAIWVSQDLGDTISIYIRDNKWEMLVTNDDYVYSFLSLYYCFLEYFNKDVLIHKLDFKHY